MMAGADDIEFRFNGRPITARPRQSVAAALHDSGITSLTVSSKYHRPRGIFCAAGRCPNCVLNVNGRPNVRTCTVEPEGGMDVRSELGRMRAAVFRGIDFVGPLFPVGFQYRYFKRPKWAYRLWEQQLRRTASHTSLPAPTAVLPPGRRVAADLAVVGAGPAGLGAASAAADAGLRVALVSRSAALGGAAKPLAADSPLGRAAARLEAAENAQVVRSGAVLGQFGRVLAVDGGHEAIRIEAEESVLATGAYERLPPFDGNDLPGVMLASAARRLLIEQDTRPGRRVVVVAGNDSPYHLIGDLLGAGVAVEAILDLRPGTELETGRQALAGSRSVRVEPAVTAIGARGRQRVQSLGARSASGQSLKFECDAVLVSGGWQPADELRRAATGRGAIVLEGDGANPLDWQSETAATSTLLQGVGSVVGARSALEAFHQGEIAGLQAAGRQGRDVGSALERARADLHSASQGGTP